MPQPTLPTEIWEQTTLEMTIDDIVALSLTSHALHDVISSSIFAWRAVVQDLLLISPNSLLSRSLHVETPQMLRAKAIRFCNVQKTLSCDDPALLQSVSTLKLPMGHSSVHPCIVTGTPYAVYVSQNRTGEAHTHKCAIHLISMTTGHVHGTCHLRATSVMTMDVHHSATYGIVVVLKHFSKEGPRSIRNEYTVQLLRVLASASSPRLEALFALPLPRLHPAHTNVSILSQIIDDTLTLQDSELGQLMMVHIPSAADAARQGTPIPIKCWVSPNIFGSQPRSSYPQMVCVLTPDALLVRVDPTHLGILRLRPGRDSSLLDTTPEVCMLEYLETKRTCFHAHHSTTHTLHLDLQARTQMIAISISRDLSSMSLDSSWDIHPPPSSGPGGHYSLLCGPQRVGYVMCGTNGMRVLLTARPSIAPEAAQRRLGTRMGRNFAMDVRLGRENERNNKGLMFDDWTGIALMSHADSRNFHDCATVIQAFTTIRQPPPLGILAPAAPLWAQSLCDFIRSRSLM